MPVGLSPKNKWVSDELDEIKVLFADNIKEVMITMEMVEVMERDFVNLKGIPLRKIYWKIRSLWEKKEEEDEVSSFGAIINDYITKSCKPSSPFLTYDVP